MKTILTAITLLLIVFSVNAQPPQKKEVPAPNPEGVYHVEIKNVLINNDVVFAPVEVGGLRLLVEKPGGFLFGEVAGIPNLEGAVRLNFDDYANQPLTAQLSWKRQSLPQGQQIKMIVYFRADRDQQKTTSQLPKDSWEFTVPRPPPPTPPPAPRIESFTVDPKSAYINCGSSATLHWVVNGCDGNCDVTLTAKDGPSYYDLVQRLPGRPPSGPLSVSPSRSTQTKYILTATNASGSDSKELVIQIYCAPKPPEPGGAGVFCFKLTNNQSLVSKCYIVALYDRDEAAAKKSAEATYPGYSAEKTSCNSVCPP